MAEPRDTGDLVADYAAGLAARTLGAHGAVSGLGVWLLLALLAPAAEGTARRTLEQALGTTAADASDRARQLLARAHPEVAEALAVWADDSQLAQAFTSWASELPSQVGRGPIPDQDEADRWVAESTRDLIRTCPLQVAEASCVLMSALATQVRWTHPFQDVPVPFAGPFTGAEVLLTPWNGHEVYLADTQTAGRVAVHRASSEGGIWVTSVIAAPDVPTADVHAAALTIDRARRVDPFTLDLDGGHSWTVEESVRPVPGATGPVLEARAFMPAWTGRSTHDLSSEPWFGAVTDLARSWLDDEATVKAQQVVTADYTQLGFSAAAVTAIGWAAASARVEPVNVRVRELTVRFEHPYAVVAVTGAAADGSEPAPAWTGIPVFNAWVARSR